MICIYTCIYKIYIYKWNAMYLFTLGRHQCRWILSSFYASIGPSVHLLPLYDSWSISDIGLIFWWVDAQYHEADCYLKWLCLANICLFHVTWKLSMIGLDQVWGKCHHCNSLKILNIRLKSGGLMHSTMKQITFKMVMLCQFLLVPWNFEIFHDRLGPGLRYDFTAL